MNKQRGAAGSRISLVVRDPQLQDTTARALQTACGIAVEMRPGSLAEHVEALAQQPPALLVAELQAPFGAELAALERLSRSTANGVSAIVIGSGLDEASTRTLLRLSVSDWLPIEASVDDLVASARQVLSTGQPESPSSGANIISFMPAVGGAGASTLCTAALEVPVKAKRAQRQECCIVDLNLESGTIADYLDTEPRLDLDEIAASPDRLDAHLLEVMLSQHKSGSYLLGARSALTIDPRIDGNMVGRLLDLAANRFRFVMIDLPPSWTAWSEIVLRGSDKFYFVSDMSVASLRHARRLAEAVSARNGTPLLGSVIVNKTTWLSSAGINRKNAQEVLGPYLAGFVPHGGHHVQMAQNHGQLLSEVKRRSNVTAALGKLIAPE